ncbi:Purine efflux pump PbuE [Lentibacillus sp. JNUCC-1]|nr:Purine efflux pump PbuE [Lentibacillus sp. JNUCC-1]
MILMERVPARPPVPIRTQLATLKNRNVLFSHLTTFLFLAGHTTLYAYLRPFLTETMGLEGTMISVVYFVFGIAAVSGGGIGGALSDTLGTRRTILGCIILFALSIFAIPYSTFAVSLFLLVTVIWGR